MTGRDDDQAAARANAWSTGYQDGWNDRPQQPERWSGDGINRRELVAQADLHGGVRARRR